MTEGLNRREWMVRGIAGATAFSSLGRQSTAKIQSADDTSRATIEVLLPRDRVPLSFIIDDSTCLVNMGYFCTPQFAACYPDRTEYQKDWKKWPREIPDSFVRRFGEWCAEHGVRGKYSIVPNPACVGWLDRELPGWSQRALQESLALVRDLMMPNWDIHPEMITHTRVIDLKTGRPMESISPATMENSYPQQALQADELAEYLAYALRILKNCGLHCQGITTPGGFGNKVKDVLPHAVGQAVREVFPDVEIPHYFKYVELDSLNTQPQLEAFREGELQPASLTMNVPAGTGDWFGGWQGDGTSEPDKYATEDARSGRMVELIEAGQPALMLCHWPGIYSNGSEEGFQSFQRVVTSLASRFANRTQWMKLSEIARYWATKELCQLTYGDDKLELTTPFACPQFTARVPLRDRLAGPLRYGTEQKPMERVLEKHLLTSGTFYEADAEVVFCVDIPDGKTEVRVPQ